MHRWAFFWGLSFGALATRLLIARTDLLAALGMPTLGPEDLTIAVAFGGALVLMAAWALVRRQGGPSAHAPDPPRADPVPDPLLEARLLEAHRLLAERNELLAFVREVLQSRTADLDRLREEQRAVAGRLDESRAVAERWRGQHERVVADLQAERARFEAERSRLSEALMRSTRETSQSARELVDAVREVTQRTREADDLRAEAAHLRAQLERLRSAEQGAGPLADV